MDHNRVSSAKQITFNSLCIRSFWSSVAFSETIASCCAPSTQIFHTSWVHKLPAHLSLARNLPVCRFELWLELSFLLFKDLKDHSNDFSCLRVRYPHGLWVIISPHMLRFPDLLFTVCEPPQYFHTVTPVFPAWLCSGLPEIAGHESTAPLPNGNCAPPIRALSTNQNMRRVSTSQEQQPGQDRVSTSACEMWAARCPKCFEVMHGLRCADVHGCTSAQEVCIHKDRNDLKQFKIKTIKRSPGHVSVRNHNWVTSLLTNQRAEIGVVVNVVLHFLHTVRTFPSHWSVHLKTSTCCGWTRSHSWNVGLLHKRDM